MAIARFLDRRCLALRASGLWLRDATLQNLIPSFPWIAAPPRPPPWRNPRKERDKILPSGNLDVNIFNFQGGQHCTNAATPSATAPPTSATSPSRTATRASASSISTPSTARRRRGRRSSGSTATMHCRDTIQLLGELNCVARFA